MLLYACLCAALVFLAYIVTYFYAYRRGYMAATNDLDSMAQHCADAIRANAKGIRAVIVPRREMRH